jgi:hypothetical protein
LRNFRNAFFVMIIKSGCMVPFYTRLCYCPSVLSLWAVDHHLYVSLIFRTDIPKVVEQKFVFIIVITRMIYIVFCTFDIASFSIFQIYFNCHCDVFR